MSTNKQKRIAELEQLAAEENIALPWPPDVIVGIEERGGYVDLTSGHVGSADVRASLTVVGEAWLVATGASGTR